MPIPCRNPLLSLLSPLLLLSLSIIPSLGYPSAYTDASPSPAPTSSPVSSTSCAPYMCGNVSISYPFHLSEAPTIPSQYCGYPEMAVFCDHETPFLITQNGNYIITEIDYPSRIVHLVDPDFLNPPNPSCLRVQHNFTFVRNSFLNYTNSDVNITFFFNCSPPLPRTDYYISCGNFYVFPSNSTELKLEYDNWIYKCKGIVVAPVFADTLPMSSSLTNQYSEALSNGFELTWGELLPDDCKDCEHCGFNRTADTACIYSDGNNSSANNGDKGKHSKGIIIGPFVGGAALAAILLLGLVFVLYRHKNRRRRIGKKNFFIKQSFSNNLWEKEERGSESLLFDFFRIAKATNNFSAENKLGQGGFGTVYKLPDGQEIAVKRLAKNSGQGLMEFKNEILVIAKLQHTNLVKLLGYSIQGEEKILIYEFMQNKSLDFFLFDQTRGALLDWSKRFHIIEGVAQGLLYLHKHSRLKIIHRDLKASNILLDDSMKPKISDFGIARIFATNEDQGNFTNKVAGTFGYISPEYAAEGRFSVKSDVFSFGVLLLEIVSGKRNAGLHQYGEFPNLLGYAWKVWKEGRWLPLVDPLLGDQYSVSEVMKCIHVALLCVQEKAGDRPTMSTVTTMLSNEGTTALPDPKQPGFFNIGGRDEAESSEINVNCSLNGVTVTDPMVR